jgi:hypothetical protein
VATYSAFPLGREFPLLIVAGFIVIDLATMGAGGLLFNVVFLVLLLLAAYWFCWHTVRELTSDGENVTWRASLRSGSINVHDLVRIEPADPLWSKTARHLSYLTGPDCTSRAALGSGRSARNSAPLAPTFPSRSALR